MSVVRINKNKNYTTMSNYHLQDKNLSLKGKGLLSVMLSLPEKWNYTVEGLVSICKENETAINSTLRELKENNYLVVKKLLPNETQSGKIEYIYEIYETPKQESEKQDLELLGVELLGVELLGVENQGQLNTKELNTNNKILNNKESIINNNTKEKDEITEIFDFWNSKSIIKHTKLNVVRIKAIRKKLKDYSIDAIKIAIEHYAIVLHDNNSFWNYTWSLEDFLNRKNGFTTFLDDGSNWVSYNKNKNPYSTQKEISRETKYPNQKDKGYIY